MQLLATFRADDVEKDAPQFDYSTFTPRPAVRGVIYNSNKVALIHVAKHGYYMLPGGGADTDHLENELKREVLEELGKKIDIKGEIGIIELYIDRWSNKQIDHGYIAEVVPSSVQIQPTVFESEEKHEIVWSNSLEEAIKLIKESSPVNLDGKLIRARDLLFLQEAKKAASNTR